MFIVYIKTLLVKIDTSFDMKKSLLLYHLILALLYQGIAQSSDNRKIVKVLTFNILHGATTKNDFNLDVIADVITNANADFVALQEVDFQTNRAKGYDLVTELGWRSKMAPIFGKAMPYDDGEYGEGILSKWTFLQSRNIALPFSPGNEPRAALEITTVLPYGDTVIFIGTHLDHLNDDTDK